MAQRIVRCFSGTTLLHTLLGLIFFVNSTATRSAALPRPGPGNTNGLASEPVTLIAAPQRLHFGAVEKEGKTYNEDYAGPLLKVKPGSTLRVTLINRLDEDTNLHFHGILASPLGRSDNMVVRVAPGQSFDYEVKIPPFQTPGLLLVSHARAWSDL